MDLKEEEILGDQVEAHWYYKAKAAALLRDLSGFTPTSVLVRRSTLEDVFLLLTGRALEE